MKYSTVYVGIDVHNGDADLFLFAVTQTRRNKPNTPRRLMVTTARASTISRPCVSTTETMLFSHAVMRLAASDSHYINRQH